MKRALLLAFVATILCFVPRADASVSIAVQWTDLLARSSDAVVALPAETRAVWENGRIYTYTRVGVDRALAGQLHTGDEVWVRTMGGIVGDVGQHVDGEAVLIPGRPSILFLQPSGTGSYDVSARGQGQFPVVLDENKKPKVIRSSSVGALMAPRGQPLVVQLVFAAEKLHGRPLDDVARDIAADWDHAHGK
jgi:hypothetical protein